jgi:hypothetical protein
MRNVFILVVGLASGYLYGFSDARTHRDPLQRRVAERMVKRAGGASRERVSGDMDAKMQRAER